MINPKPATYEPPPLIEPGHTFASVTDHISSIVLRKKMPPSWWLLFGVGTLLFVGSLAGPRLQTAFHEHGVRVKLAQAISAMKPLQRQVEEDWTRRHSIPEHPDFGSVRAHEGYASVRAVDFNAGNGRVRFELGPAVPEVQGRSILLAPALDGSQKVRWLCIPIDIPIAYVPVSCGH